MMSAAVYIDTPWGRRRERRFTVTGAARVVDESGTAELATIVNLSASGLMLHFAVRPPMEVGRHVQVTFLGTEWQGTIKHISPARQGILMGIRLDT